MNLNSLDCELNDAFQNPKISLINANAISEIPEDLLFTQLSFYKNVLAKKPEKTCSVKNILEHISSGQWKGQITYLRKLSKLKNNDSFSKLKKNLRAFTASGTFNGRTGLVEHSGLLQGDIDHVSDPQGLRDQLVKDPHVLAAFISASANGVKTLIRIPKAKDSTEHKKSFFAAERYFSENYKINLDPQRKDINGLCFISYDSDLKTNPNAIEIDIQEWSPISDENKLNKSIKSGNWLKDKKNQHIYGTVDWISLFKSQQLFLGYKRDNALVLCPNRLQHSNNTDGSSSTSILRNGPNGRQIFKCFHAHCEHIDGFWLENHFDSELILKFSEPFIQKIEVSDDNNPKNLDKWPDEPEPFFNLKRTPGKYPLEAYPPIIKNAVEAFVNYAQTPISMTASIALGYAATSVQHLALVARDEQTFGPCSLYVLNIAQSGERKSTVDRAFEKGIRELERINKEKADHYEEALSMDGSSKRIIYEDATAEGLAVELQNNNKSIVLASSEGGSIFGSVGMRGEAILKALSFFNKAWDADTQSMSRKQSESVYLKDYRVSLKIAVQFESLDYWLEKHIGLAKGIGFLGRFLVNVPDSNIGQRFYRKAPRNVHELNAFQEACVFSLRQSSDLEQPRIIDFTQEAESEWIKYFDETEEAQKVGGRWEQNKASASKSPEQAARIAAVFTLIENPGSTEIPGSVMSNANEVTRYHLNESLRLEGQTGATQIERDAQILLKWLADQDLSIGWSTSRIKQYGPNSIRKPDRCDAALKLLEIYGYLKIIYEGRKVKIRFHPKFPECIKRENQYSNSR